MSNAISKWEQPTNATGLAALAPVIAKRVAAALPGFLAGQEQRLMSAMITETSRNPTLLECTPRSLFGAVIQAGQLGLTIGGPLGEAFLIPFSNRKAGGKEATLIPGYKGLIQLMHRSDKVKRVTPGIVREGDSFTFTRGRNQDLQFKPLRNNRGKVTDYYFEVELLNGGYDFETFTFEDALAWRDRFATTRNAPQFVRDKSPWYDMDHGFHEQACKTLARKIAKRTPLSVDMTRAAQLEDAADHEQPQNLAQLAGDDLAEPDHMPSKAEQLRERLDATKAGEHIVGVDDPDLDGLDAQAR